MKARLLVFYLLLFLFTFCHYNSIAQGNWSNPISLTNASSNNTNATIQGLQFMEDDFYVFWEEATDTLASAINYKRFYGENELMTLRSEEGVHFKNPQLINTQKPSIDTNFIVLYEDDSKGYNDISIQFYTSEGFSTPASLTSSSLPKSSLMANFVGDIVWLEMNKVMFMKYDVYNDSFSEAIVIDSGNCSFPSVKQTDGMWGWGGYPILSWIKEENDSTYIKLKRQEYNGEWLDTEIIFAGTSCTNLSFDGGFGFTELLSWDHYYDGTWHLKIYHTLEDEIMEMEFTQDKPFYPYVFSGDLPVKTSYFEGIACLSFISSNGDESDVLTSPYLFWVEQNIESYENLSDTENEVRNIKTFLGKSEPGCKQYFINIWEERVDENWQLKYSEIWTCLSTIDESISDDFFLNAFPNPFQQSIEFSFILDQPENVNLAVYDILGNKIATLVDDRLTSGNHLYKWNGNAYSNGMYFVSLQTNTKKILRKITLTK